jgi:hypothetical protein
MNSVFEYEYLDHVSVCRSTERRSMGERRSGIDNRVGNLVKNENVGPQVESSELVQSLDNTKFISEFGWF